MYVIPDCPICKGEGADGLAYAAVPCGHVFHIECFEEYLARPSPRKNCPTCDKPFESNPIIMVPVYVEKAPAPQLAIQNRRSLDVDLVAVHESLTRTIQEQNSKILELEEEMRQTRDSNKSLEEVLAKKNLEIAELEVVGGQKRQRKKKPAVLPVTAEESTIRVVVTITID